MNLWGRNIAVDHFCGTSGVGQKLGRSGRNAFFNWGWGIVHMGRIGGPKEKERQEQIFAHEEHHDAV